MITSIMMNDVGHIVRIYRGDHVKTYRRVTNATLRRLFSTVTRSHAFTTLYSYHCLWFDRIAETTPSRTAL